jgi:glutathione peroxidase
MDGRTVRLADFRNRKMLFVFIPASMNDSTISLEQLASIQHKYDSSLVTIGIPVSEQNKLQEEKLRSAYQDFQHNFIVTETMTAKSISSEKPDPLIAWLTHKEKNQHFTSEWHGAGQKFFVDERGELYATLGSEIKLSSSEVDQLLSMHRMNK